MIIRALRAELIKGRHAPVWIAFVVLPLIPAFLGTFNYLGNLALLKSSWYSLWTQHTLFASYFFLPALLAVYCAWEWRLENTDHNFNSFLTAPISTTALYLGKLIPAIGVSVLAQLVVGLLFIGSGFLAGIREPLPPELFEWLCCGALGSIAVCAVQLFLSLLIKSFAIPVAIGRHRRTHGDGPGLGAVFSVLAALRRHARQQSEHGDRSRAACAVDPRVHRALCGAQRAAIGAA